MECGWTGNLLGAFCIWQTNVDNRNHHHPDHYRYVCDG